MCSSFVAESHKTLTAHGLENREGARVVRSLHPSPRLRRGCLALLRASSGSMAANMLVSRFRTTKSRDSWLMRLKMAYVRCPRLKFSCCRSCTWAVKMWFGNASTRRLYKARSRSLMNVRYASGGQSWASEPSRGLSPLKTSLTTMAHALS